MTAGLHWTDGLIIAMYAIGMLGLGAFYGSRQKTSDEYFVGDRSMSPFLIGVSIFATLFSTISYLSTPGEIINHGPVVLTGALMVPITYVVVGFLIIPVYMRHRVTSAYELLEHHLGVRARMVGATLFVLLRLVWMSTLIFFASRSMLTMLGLDIRWLSMVTFITGAIAIGYSSIGGLRAVVITDLFQFILLFGGACLVVGMVTYRLGGLDWFPTRWSESWDTQPLFGGPTVRVTVLGTLVHGLLWWVCTAGSDQTAIQRFMATGDAAAARRSFLFNSVAGLAVSLVLALVGFSLLAYFQSDVARLPAGMTIAEDADLLFPLFISHHLPAGLSGLVVSGMFAAAMSSLDSGVNSITAVVMTDFVERSRGKPMDERTRTRRSRVMAITIGLLVVAASSFMQYVPGNFLEISQRTLGLFVPPLFTLFFLAMFTRTKEWAAILGGVVSLQTAVIVAYWQPLTGLPMLSFQCIIPCSLASGIFTGILASRLSGQSKRTAGE